MFNDSDIASLSWNNDHPCHCIIPVFLFLRVIVQFRAIEDISLDYFYGLTAFIIDVWVVDYNLHVVGVDYQAVQVGRVDLD